MHNIEFLLICHMSMFSNKSYRLADAATCTFFLPRNWKAQQVSSVVDLTLLCLILLRWPTGRCHHIMLLKMFTFTQQNKET